MILWIIPIILFIAEGINILEDEKNYAENLGDW
jgi:hypothetical protein